MCFSTLRILIPLLFSLLLTLRTRAQEELGNPETSYDLLAQALERKIGELDWGGGVIAIAVHDLDNALPVFEKQADRAAAPGSLMKLFTAAAALDLLGPEFTFKTELLMNGSVQGRALDGGLLIRGDGDPTIGTAEGDAGFELFDRWAGILKARRIKTITGPIQLDTTCFDDQRRPTGWPPDQNGEPRLPDVTPLSFNQNRVDFIWESAGRAGKSGKYVIWPPINDYLLVSNNVRTAERPLAPRVYRRTADARVINITGDLPLKTPARDRASAPGAPIYFGEVLRTRLAQKGITIEAPSQEIILDEKPDYTREAASDAPAPELLDTHASPQLFTIIQKMLREDETLSAEVILKTLGRVPGQSATTAAGAAAVARSIRERRIPPTGLVMLDGSGQSNLNRVSPLQIMSLLRVLRREHPWRRVVTDCFARPGQPGPLQDRMSTPPLIDLEAETDPDSEANDPTATPSPTPRPTPSPTDKGGVAPEPKGEVWALPGHLRGASSMAGWASTVSGHTLHFVIMVNDSKLDPKMLDQAIDAVVRQIMNAQI